MTDYFSIDNFPCGGLVIDKGGVIVYSNSYIERELGWSFDSLIGERIDKILTRSSKIFYQSYLAPMLIHDKKCEELQLTILNSKGIRIPTVVNVRVDDLGISYWSLFNATKRDKLYEELINTRAQLESQADALKKLASVDELTGLLNRREVLNRSTTLLEQAARSAFMVCFVMIDIDHFKKVNDNYGHAEGDRVLKALGQCLINFSRKTDLISRYGGEEFLLVFPDTAIDQTMMLSERLHEEISNILLINGKPITVSIGVSYNRKLACTFDDIFNQADIALYKAKSTGRNRTVLYETDKDTKIKSQTLNASK
jgi:diguanylate cyclase (GGDEF)-like protein